METANKHQNKSIAVQLNYTELINTPTSFLSRPKEIKLKGQNIPITDNLEKNPEGSTIHEKENLKESGNVGNMGNVGNTNGKISFKQIDIENIKQHKRELLKKTLNETMQKIKSIDSDITIHSDSPDAYIKDKIIYMPSAGKYTKIIKKFYNLGSSEKLEAFKLSSA